jgi:lysine-specific demethylase 3
MSRFCKDELSQAIKDMEALLLELDADNVPAAGAIDPTLVGQNVATNHSYSIQPISPLNALDLSAAGSVAHTPSDSSLTMTSTESTGGSSVQSEQLHPNGNLASVDEIPCHVTRRFTDSELTDDVFRPLWEQGEPLVVTGLLPKFRVQWTPEYFKEKYHMQSCLVIECQTDVNKRVTVGEFFSWFGHYENRKECWKLKV